eukprot:gene32537-7862_t
MAELEPDERAIAIEVRAADQARLQGARQGDEFARLLQAAGAGSPAKGRRGPRRGPRHG